MQGAENTEGQARSAGVDGPSAVDRLSHNASDRAIVEMVETPAAEPVRLSVFGLVLRSWLIFFGHIDVFLMLMWRPFALTALGALAVVWAAPFIGPAIPAVAFVVLSLVVVVPVITAWHRMILLGAENPRADVAYEVGGAEWTYLKGALFLYGLGYAVGLFVRELYGPLLGGLLVRLADSGNDPYGLVTAYAPAFVHWLSIILILGFLVARLFLVLPAAAVGMTYSFAESASATRGHGLRLVAAYLLASLPPLGLAMLFDSPMTILTQRSGSDVQFMDLLLGILPRIVLYTIAVGILSLAFERLVGLPRSLREKRAIRGL